MICLEAGIVGRDPDILVPFYVDTLQFEVVHRLEFPDDGLLVKLRREAARLKLFFPRNPPTAAPVADPYWGIAGWRYAALCFNDQDEMRRVFARVDGSGGRVVMAPRSHRPDAEAALVADPEGNHWELLWERENA